MYKIFFLFVVLSSSLSWSLGSETGKPSQGPAPSWVKSHAIAVEMPPVRPSQVNLQYLLIDTQKNIEERTFYHHLAIKALTQSGTESVSQVKIDFDPLYTQVVMHHIRVLRDGKWCDKLESARHSLIQRETDLEQNLYNGELTLVYFLDDIREGDVVEYAYSSIGDSPLASLRYTEWMYLQQPFAVEKITYRLLAKPTFTFSIKPINTEVVPQVQDLTPLVREWTWEATQTSPHVEERGQPIWYNPPAQIQTSGYNSWKEVGENILPLYSLSEDFFSPEMEDLTQKWQAASTDLSKQALLALRFVQDEIRYLGFEEGMKAFQPADPATTLRRRFGDCKDKAFLLHALLKTLGIPSKVMLVHTRKGRRLPSVLPTPFVFNHVVLQLEIGSAIYFVDPTWSLQGGSLEENFFPDYEWGLVLAENSSLISLPKQLPEHPTEIDSHFAVVEEDVAHLIMKSTFYQSDADRMRRSLHWRGAKRISEYCLSEMQHSYGMASLKEAMQTSDDRENNIVTLTESYILPTRAVQDRKRLNLLSHIHDDYLCAPINPQRCSPYEISYPLWIKERVRLETPFMQWTPFKDHYKQTHEAFFYNCSTEIEKHQACFEFELKHLQDHIPKETLHDSWKILTEISRQGVPCMTVVAPPKSSTRNTIPQLPFFFLAVICWLVIHFIGKKIRLLKA